MSAMAHVVNGVVVTVRDGDRYVNATALCRAGGKLWADYDRNRDAHRFREQVALNMGIPIFDLIEKKRGGGGGTWVHPQVAWHLCQWISPRFSAQVAEWVETLATTGRVELPNAPPRPSPVSAPSGFTEIVPDSSDPFEAQIVVLQQTLAVVLDTRRRQVALERQQAALAAQQAETRAVADAALARVEEVCGVQADTHALAVCASNTARAARDEVHGFHGYATILAFFGRQRWALSLEDAKRWGRLMSRACRERGVAIQSIKHEAYPSVNVYPEWVFREVFADRLAAQGSNEVV